MTGLVSSGAFMAFMAFAAMPVGAQTDSDIGCFVPGVCKGGLFIDIDNRETKEDCLDLCKDTVGCRYFTHYEDSGACFSFLTCPEVNFDDCGTICRSGDVTCNTYICDTVGLCKGHTLRFEQDETHTQCKANCYADPECTWYGFHTDATSCLLMADCVEIDEVYRFARSGQRECYENAEEKDYTKVFAVGGCDVANQNSCSDSAELLDISDGSTILNCPVPAPFPYEVSYALAARVNDYPMICGGFGLGSVDPQSEKVLSECHRYYNGSWTYLGDTLEPRQGAAGLQLPNGTLWITGGQSSPGGVALATTESVNTRGESSYEVDLPVPLVHHVVVQVSEFLFGVIGGMDNQQHASNQFWAYDVRTEGWTRMEDMMTARYGHVCERTFSVDRGQEIVCAGGTTTGSTPLASTEVFSLTNFLWAPADDLPEPLLFAASVQKGDTLVTLGGKDNELDSEVGTYHYDVPTQSWSDSLEERLTSKRFGVAAISVDTGLAQCVP